MKKIFVNNTAATSGGALSILKQFVSYVVQNDPEHMYYIFCNTDLEQYNNLENVIIINLNQPKSMISRLKWDYFGMKKWAEQQNIEPDLIISLQNTAVYGYKNIPQIIYLHQPIPFYPEHKWSILKHKKLWFYQNIYKMLIVKGSVDNKVVVQTDWFALRAKKVLTKTRGIVRIRPNGANFDLEAYEDKNNMTVEDEVKLFYPTSPIFYKNYELLCQAMNKIKNPKIKLYLTLNKTDITSDLIDVSENIIFLGSLSHEDTIKHLSSASALVFPSYMETFGLPLLEAAELNKRILTVDLDYAKEVLRGYNKAKFLNPYSVDEWAKTILELVNETENKLTDFHYENEWHEFIKLIEVEIKNK